MESNLCNKKNNNYEKPNCVQQFYPTIDKNWNAFAIRVRQLTLQELCALTIVPVVTGDDRGEANRARTADDAAVAHSR